MIKRKNTVLHTTILLAFSSLVYFFPVNLASVAAFWHTSSAPLYDQSSPNDPLASGSGLSTPGMSTGEETQESFIDLTSPINRDAADALISNQPTENLITESINPAESAFVDQPVQETSASEVRTTETRPAPKSTTTSPTKPTTTTTTTTTSTTIKATSTPTPTPTPIATDPVPTATEPTVTAPQPTQVSASTLQAEILNLTNQARQAEGLAALSSPDSLNQAAGCRASELSISLSHTRPDGRPFYTVYSDYGIAATAGAENFERVPVGPISATDVVNSWLASPVHRTNIMNASFTQLGIGIYVTGSYIHFVQLFAA